MDERNETRTPAPRNMLAAAGGECAKEAVSPDVSRIEYDAPENSVRLSSRLEHLVRRVGGCQTDEVMALVRRIMFEVISQRKY